MGHLVSKGGPFLQLRAPASPKLSFKFEGSRESLSYFVTGVQQSQAVSQEAAGHWEPPVNKADQGPLPVTISLPGPVLGT